MGTLPESVQENFYHRALPGSGELIYATRSKFDDQDPQSIQAAIDLYVLLEGERAAGQNIRVLRPAVIIQAHGHAKVVILLSAQIGNFVARLSRCSAETSQNNCRNPYYPELPKI